MNNLSRYYHSDGIFVVFFRVSSSFIKVEYEWHLRRRRSSGLRGLYRRYSKDLSSVYIFVSKRNRSKRILGKKFFILNTCHFTRLEVTSQVTQNCLYMWVHWSWDMWVHRRGLSGEYRGRSTRGYSCRIFVDGGTEGCGVYLKRMTWSTFTLVYTGETKESELYN